MPRLPLLLVCLSLAVVPLTVISASAIEAPQDYAALVEPDDRLEIHSRPLLDRLAANPDDLEAGRSLLDTYRRFGAWEEGLALGERLATLAPDDPAILLSRIELMSKRIDAASIFGKKGVAEELIALCEAAHARKADNTGALRCMAQFHLSAPSMVGGDKAKAEAALQALAPLDPANHLMLRANQAFAAEEWEKGHGHLAAALPLLDSAASIARLGMIRVNNLDGDGGFAAFDKAAAIDPADPFLLYQLGRASAVTGQRLEEGRNALLRFLSGSAWIGGTDFRPAAHWRLGMIHEALGDKTTAAKAYRRALALDPKNKDAKAALKKLGS